MKPISRILILFGSLSLLATFYLPIWKIELSAPQYPEGLEMSIWLSKLSGDVDTISGLNHYIGMKHIKQEMFPEFQFLSYIMAFFIAFGIATAVFKNRKILLAYLLTLVAGGVAALVDFYMWGYDYGHNLDPTAPIIIPDMYYQPPLIGYKQLLNFGAYSIPDTGGWLVIAVGLVVGGTWAYEQFFRK